MMRYWRLILAVFLFVTVVTAVSRREAGLPLVTAEPASTISVPLGYTFAQVTEIPFEGYFLTYDRERNYLYFYNGSQEIRRINFNTKTNTIIHSLYDVRHMSLSPNGRYLYIGFDIYNERIRVFDTVSQQVVRTIQKTPNTYEFVATNNDRLVIAGSNSHYLVDAITGTVLDHLTGQSGINDMVLSADGNLLYIAAGFNLEKYDITTGKFVLLDSTDEIGYQVLNLQLSPDESYLLIRKSYDPTVYRVDVSDMMPMDSFTFPSANAPIVNRDIAISVDGSHYYGVWGHNIVEIDAQNNAATRIYHSPFIYPPRNLIAIKDNRLASFEVEEMIRILTPTSYGVALPAALNKYCAGPLLDTFDNPASGWPSGVSGATTFRYLSGEYNIYHAAANRWFGVTAGHVWQNHRTLEVEGRVANNKDGAFSVILNLNDDWSEFYSFEVYQTRRIYLLLHFTAANGWEVITASNSPHINPAGKNKVTIFNDFGGRLNLRINDSLTAFIPNNSGRVGLAAVSLEKDVDVRFDNYLFVGETCLLPGEMLALESPLPATAELSHTRPSLTEILPEVPAP